LAVAGDAAEIMIIGGSQVYDWFLPLAGRLYLTRVQSKIAGDAYFPAIDESDWELVDSVVHEATAANEFGFDFRTYERKGHS
jgi:dihydrofolate reductase